MDRPDLSDPESLKQFYLQVLDRYGEESQSDAIVEEAAELIQAICKYRHAARRGRDLEEALEKVVDEIADVEIALDQAKLIYYGRAADAEKLFAEKKRQKLAKLADKMD